MQKKSFFIIEKNVKIPKVPSSVSTDVKKVGDPGEWLISACRDRRVCLVFFLQDQVFLFNSSKNILWALVALEV